MARCHMPIWMYTPDHYRQWNRVPRRRKHTYTQIRHPHNTHITLQPSSQWNDRARTSYLDKFHLETMRQQEKQMEPMVLPCAMGRSGHYSPSNRILTLLSSLWKTTPVSI